MVNFEYDLIHAPDMPIKFLKQMKRRSGILKLTNFSQVELIPQFTNIYHDERTKGYGIPN